MLKKLLIAVVAVAVGLTVVKSTKIGSLMRVKWNEATAWCNKQIPVQDEIASLRLQIANLGKDTKSHCQVIAEEMVAVDNLKREIGEAEAKLEQQKKKITAMRDALADGGTQKVVLGERTFSRGNVQKQLVRDFDLYKTCEAQLAAKKKLLESRQECLAKAREQLAAMQDTRRDLEVQVSQLEAQYNTLKVTQTKSKFALDDSALSKVKEGVNALRTRIKTLEQEAAIQAEFGDGEITAGDTVKTKDLLKEIDNHFGKDQGKVASK
jgi:peptidoglycan hydrolase CwlO-like protein